MTELGIALLLVTVGLVVLLLFIKEIRIIPQARAANVERGGRYRRTLGPGLNFVVPFLDRVKPLIDLREQVVSFENVPVITEDKLEVHIDMVLFFQVTDPRAADYEVVNYVAAIEQLIITALRSVIGSMDLEQTLTSRDRINTMLRGMLDEAAGKWGLRVTRVEIKAVDAAPSIMDAMERQYRAQWEKHAAIPLADGASQPAAPKSGGQSRGTASDDIELEIGAGSGVDTYAVRVVHAVSGGEPEGTLQLDVEEVLSRRDLMEATVLASAVARRSVPAAEQPVREVGQQLFQALFTGPVYGTYRASMGVAQQRGTRLRVVLRLTVPKLAALPWETLFDQETGTYLCRQEPLVRHVPAPYTPDPLPVRPPLRILGLVASPRGLAPLDVDAEKDRLAEALAEPVAEGLVEVVWVPQATWAGVHTRLLAGEWHVLHFVGHGDYDTETGEGVLALVGSDGRADLVEAGRIADLLGEAQPTPRLVVLNSCSSGQTGMQDLFSGTAAALARSGISAVAAMQFAISNTAAIAFARGFYTAIAHGRSVDEAARSGRISILGTPRSLEWVTPVLYVRGDVSQLFTACR
jgi:regulator of protease activity HflC (stomatin/prohibitin superfamily)